MWLLFVLRFTSDSVRSLHSFLWVSADLSFLHWKELGEHTRRIPMLLSFVCMIAKYRYHDGCETVIRACA